MTVREEHPRAHPPAPSGHQVLQGLILSGLAMGTLWMTHSPTAVPVVVSSIAFAFKFSKK